jgi:alanyl-tRNA synthetase
VGIIKVLSCQKFREGVRLEIVCGQRALEYLSAVYDQDRAVAQRLSVKPVDTLAAVERLETELSAAKLRTAELEEQVFFHIAREYAEKGSVLLFQPPMRADSVRKLADTVARRCGGLSAVFSGEADHYAYALVRTDGGDISALVRELNQALHGRGGGRNGFAQGSVQAERSAIQDFFQQKGDISCVTT